MWCCVVFLFFFFKNTFFVFWGSVKARDEESLFCLFLYVGNRIFCCAGVNIYIIQV